MGDAPPPQPRPEPPRFEDYPLTRQEYINVMVHFYRGEVQRSLSWRSRLDATTNWSILTTAGVVSFAFGDPTHPHVLLLLSNAVLAAFLTIEARRFRYFEVYRARVRMLEENFLIPVITRHLESPMSGWREMIAMDLDLPKYKTTLAEAIGFRLRQNYIWIFALVLGAWVVKLALHPALAVSPGELWQRAAVGAIPAWLVAGGVAAFHGLLGFTVWHSRHVRAGEPEDEIAGLERNLEHWKL